MTDLSQPNTALIEAVKAAAQALSPVLDQEEKSRFYVKTEYLKGNPHGHTGGNAADLFVMAIVATRPVRQGVLHTGPHLYKAICEVGGHTREDTSCQTNDIVRLMVREGELRDVTYTRNPDTILTNVGETLTPQEVEKLHNALRKRLSEVSLSNAFPS